MTAADRRARLAVFWIFGLCGVICSLWSTSLPAINARLHLGETRLGERVRDLEDGLPPGGTESELEQSLRHPGVWAGDAAVGTGNELVALPAHVHGDSLLRLASRTLVCEGSPPRDRL